MSAAKASWETDSGRRSNLRPTSGRSAGRRPEHRCVGGHRHLLHAPTDIFHKIADLAHRQRLLFDAPALQGVYGASLDVRGATEIKIKGVA